MHTSKTKFKNVDEYNSSFSKPVSQLLETLRKTIKKTAPEATEVISYNMPAYKLGKILVYYAAYKNHIGFYPMPSIIQKFKTEIAAYKNAKGSVQFPIDKPLPVELITNMLKFRISEM